MKMPQFSAVKLVNEIGRGSEWLEAHWYAAQTRSRHEKRIVEQLQAKSIECFLPLYSIVSRWKDRNTTVQLPLFPGYVFVHVALRDRMPVLQLRGVVRLLGQDNRPEALPEIDIESLRNALSNQIPLEPHPYLTIGESVLITNGPFEGMEGVLVRKNRLRVVLSLPVIHSSFVLDVDVNDVRPSQPRPVTAPLWMPQWEQRLNFDSPNRT
jgi:transcription antitermination factor NusG